MAAAGAGGICLGDPYGDQGGSLRTGSLPGTVRVV